MSTRRICVFVGSRANYASIKKAMEAIRAHPDLELHLVVGASALLDRYGRVIDRVREDGFEINQTFHMIVEGETPATMAKSTGLGMIEMATVLANERPDFLLVVGDRFEIAAIALAGAYMNVPIAHTMGGEVTGTIDESVRHAVTKLAHVHFPANRESADRIIRMGERPEHVFEVGCPRIDMIAEILQDGELTQSDFGGYTGVGEPVDWRQPFLLVNEHPVTTEYSDARDQIEETLAALAELAMPTIMLWPNVDAGSEDIVKGIRTFRELHDPDWLQLFVNLPHRAYAKLMAGCGCLLGNSSSAVREGAFIGVPAVNVGTRQQFRQRGANVIDVPHDRAAIVEAVRQQIDHGRYPTESIYGDGRAGGRIAEILATVQVDIQKASAY